MNQYPQRKPTRIENYDDSTPGAYYITVCSADREGRHSPVKTMW